MAGRHVTLAFAALAALPVAAWAQNAGHLSAEYLGGYNAAIWVDPDGCEHWVMDTGVEGFMSQHLDAAGKPVCRPSRQCQSLDGDALFAPGAAGVNPASRQALGEFFSEKASQGYSFVIYGHTDDRGDAEANWMLGQARADAVAEIARASGGSAEARSFGQTRPRADNATLEGRRLNRRVEVFCQ